MWNPGVSLSVTRKGSTSLSHVKSVMTLVACSDSRHQYISYCSILEVVFPLGFLSLLCRPTFLVFFWELLSNRLLSP